MRKHVYGKRNRNCIFNVISYNARLIYMCKGQSAQSIAQRIAAYLEVYLPIPLLLAAKGGEANYGSGHMES